MKQIIYILLLLFSIMSFAQEVVVSGKVIDKKTGEVIPGVSINIDKTNKGTQTDFNGKYLLKVSLNDTLTFSYIGMKTQKIVVDKKEIKIQLEDDGILIKGGLPYMPPKIRPKEISTITIKELKTSQKKLSNPKYNFKKNAKENVFIIFVSELTAYNFNKEDIEFQQKYNVKYSLMGRYKIDYLIKYNKLTFKHLKKKYKKSWLKEIRKDAVGLEIK